MQKYAPIREESHAKYLQLYYEYLEVMGYKTERVKMLHGCVKEYLSWLERIKEEQVYESKSIKEIDFKTGMTAGILTNYYNRLEERRSLKTGGKMAYKTIGDHLLSLKLFYGYLLEMGEIKTDPLGIIQAIHESKKYRKKEEQNRYEVLTLKEIEKLLEASNSRLERAMLSLYYGCGLRRSEALELQIRDVDFNRRILKVRKGKGGKSRVVPIAGRALEYLEDYWQKERKYRRLTSQIKSQITIKEEKETGQRKEFFLLNEKNRTPERGWFLTRLKKLQKKVGINKNVTIHGLRHSIACHLIEGGMSMEKVSRFLGHKRLGTTQIYLRNDVK